MAPLESQPKRKQGAWTWGANTVLADWPAGSLHQLDEPPPGTAPPAPKRIRHGWAVKTETLSSIFNENKHRVSACFDEGQSQGVVECNKLVDQLHDAMQHAPIEDHRLSVAGEKHRILTRALAMREMLLIQDPAMAALFAEEGIYDGEGAHKKGCNINMSRSSNEAAADATPSQCVLSVCLLLAALYEQTPYGEGADLRRQIYHDFTLLKRDFRKDELTVLKGRTGTTEELFNSVKALDRTQGLDNVLGVLFEDWRVYSKRVDPFIMADQLDVQVLTLTADGPIGKFMCKLRSLMTLCLLHQRLLKELYVGAFANRMAPIKQYEMMTAEDHLDFIDFTEAMARNMPHKHVEGTNLFYAWMYSPEVHAPPAVWEQIFGKGQNRLPTLFEGVKTPDDAVKAGDDSGDYSLDIEEAIKHDFRSQGSAQAAVGFPWSDDLIGAYLRRVKQQSPEQRQEQRRRRQQQQEKAKQSQQPQQPQQQQEAGVAPTPAQHQGQQGPPQPVCAGDQPMQGPGEPSPDCGPRRHVVQLSLSSQQAWTLNARANTCWAAPPGQHMPRRPQPPPQPIPQGPPEPIPNIDETGHLALPLGIFMVGIICSGAFTNTQIHVEDLLLMSININIFGAPKVWWWLPKDKMQAFKAAAELMTEGGRGELYTKSISPFLTDREYGYPEHILPLDRLRDLGARRTIQMPGMGIWTMPGYAFHFTVSMGLNVAESANMFLEVMGWTFEKLWQARPLEQYPDLEDDMGRYMRETGLLAGLEVEDRLPRHAAEVHRELTPRMLGGPVKAAGSQKLLRRVYSQVVKYRALPSRGAATEPTSPVSSEDVDVSESSADALTSSGSDAFEAVRSSSRPFETSDTIKMLSAGLLNMTQEQTPAVASVMSTMTTAMVS